MVTRFAAVSVDLDEIPEYLGIHALPSLPDDAPAAHAVHDRALDRIASWAASMSTPIPITFFSIGRDLARPRNAEALRHLAARGHAVESHSMSHRYDLSRLPPEEIARDVEQSLRTIELAVGARPTGFRAPGYAVSEPLFDALEDAGVTFDSSVFPSPVYWAAKASVLAWMGARGRASASILDTPKVLLAPRTPYRPARPYHRRALADGRHRRFIELPIQVTPLVGFPLIGTFIGRAGPSIARLLARTASTTPFVNLELHGMDFVAPADLGSHPLTRLQPELHTPLDHRIDALTSFVETLQTRGFTFVTLAEAARELAPPLGA